VDLDAIDVVPASSANWSALAELFSEGGDPKSCWCAYFRLRSSEFSRMSVSEHAGVLHGLTERPLAPGLVALEPNGRAVGWVSLGPRDDFERLRRSHILAPVDDTPVWTIVCFVVARRARRNGLMRHLLEAAITFARANGAPALEAYPVDTSRGRPSVPTLYSGSLRTFLSLGFAVVRDVDSPSATVVRTIVRRRLAETAPSEPAAGAPAPSGG
jgi:GNAT superfamily N-acetyltransferase